MARHPRSSDYTRDTVPTKKVLVHSVNFLTVSAIDAILLQEAGILLRDRDIKLSL